MDNEEKVVDAAQEAAQAPEAQTQEAEAAAEVEAAAQTPAPSWLETLVEGLKGQFGEAILSAVTFREQDCITVSADKVVDVCMYLRDTEGYDFAMLTDLTAVDNMGEKIRFTVVYNLYSFSQNLRLRVKAPVAEGADISTVENVWKAANWMEREVYDLFGINFEGHSNMKRILLWDGYDGHPLRKDFPLTGKPQAMTYR
jgi:NADH-quinone oxidoreductase subunit C